MRRPWLAPLIPLYMGGLALRELRLRKGWEPVRRLRWPVVSIGNLSVGGAGKTPMAIALARLLSRNGFHVDVLSRGYGRESREAARVDAAGSAAEFGDEPLLIAREAGVPVYVAPQRYAAGAMAEADAPQAERGVHLLDDGFQHRQLHRDVDILLVHRRDLVDDLLPGGNLREPLSAMRRASMVAIDSDEPVVEQVLREQPGAGQPALWNGPVWRVRRVMEAPQAPGPVVAFCGIAQPEQFFAGLAAAGLQLVGRIAFPDHHAYRSDDLQRILTAAREARAASFVTTEKDAVRLRGKMEAFPASVPVLTAQLRVELEDEAVALQWLTERLAALRL